jgi:hypothetical protein
MKEKELLIATILWALGLTGPTIAADTPAAVRRWLTLAAGG